MANKRWSFKVPGDPGGSEKVVDIGEISSVYDLLDSFRKNGGQPRQKKQASQPGPGSGGVLIPFASRRMEKRRHPSA